MHITVVSDKPWSVRGKCCLVRSPPCLACQLIRHAADGLRLVVAANLRPILNAIIPATRAQGAQGFARTYSLIGW
jgi:hypothetical protein